MNERVERIRIIGVDCPTCIYAIRRGLERLRCVSKFEADPSTGLSIVIYDQDVCSLNDIYRVIREAGYDVEKQVVVLLVENMDDYGECRVENTINKYPGVLETKVSFATRLVKIMFNPSSVNSVEILNYFVKNGFRVKQVSEVVKRKEPVAGMLLYRRLAAFSIGLSIVSLSIAGMYFELKLYIMYLVFASTMVLLLIADIIHRGFKSILRFNPTMESFVTVSVTIAYTAGLVSFIGLISHESVEPEVFFEASAGVGGFISFGLFLEERLRTRAFEKIEELTNKLYGKARVIREDSIVEVDAHSVEPGETIVVKAGEIIPVDGIVVDGWGYVDESNFTGEPGPRFKNSESRDYVLAGTLLASGFLKIRATRVGGDTVLSRIVETVMNAQFYKPSIVRAADRIVGLFTWLIIVLGLFTMSYWVIVKNSVDLAFLFTSSLFVAACPCALGIAIPLVVSFSIIKASRKGLLIKRSDVFERVLEANIVFFDKTGTLTIGKPGVKAIYSIKNSDVRELLYYVCSVESRSEHLLAKTIIDYCVERKVDYVEVTGYESFPGMGVVGFINNKRILVGNIDLVKSFELELSSELERVVEDIASRGSTPIIIAIDNSVSGVIEVSDVLRKESIRVIEELKKKGYRVGIASGDHRYSVEYFAGILGFDYVYYELKPIDKEDLVKKYEESGFKTIFVGDGFNDAPALTRATVGVAMGRGVDVARESGDVVLMRSNLSDLLTLVELSREARGKFLQNLLWAFIYNIVLIPVAMGLLYEPYGLMLRPEYAALAMILSDTSVILNATTMLFKKT